MRATPCRTPLLVHPHLMFLYCCSFVGKVTLQTVLRSDPKGVSLMRSYPNILDDPGVESWIEDEEWKCEKVFEHMKRVDFNGCEGGDAAPQAWEALKQWHSSHPSSDYFSVGEPIKLTPNIELPTNPSMTWREVWGVICPGNGSQASTSSAPSSKPPPKPFLNPKSKRPDRQALSKSTSTAELNRVVDGEHYSKQARTQRCLIDKSNAQSHIQKLLPVQGSLFLIRLGHQEGELAVGLGRRLFDEASDDDVSKLVGALFLFTHLAH
jgi:hypothetical protein